MSRHGFVRENGITGTKIRQASHGPLVLVSEDEMLISDYVFGSKGNFQVR
jgi:hypothetical protein